MKQIYFDYAAATPLLPEVVESMRLYYQDLFYNPSGLSLASRQVASDISIARQTVAHWLGAKPTELIFTAGGTEANNLAIAGIMQQYTGASVVTTAIEHDAVLRPVSTFKHRLVDVGSDGVVEPDNIIQAIDDTTVLVSVMYVNNEVGTIQPLQAIAKKLIAVKADRLARGVKLPLYFHTDACQAPSYLDIHAHNLSVDLMTLNAGKIYGPKQTGCLYVRTGVIVAPLIMGGGQERGLRSGTENVANIVGFATALDIVQTERKQETKRLSDLRDYFIKQLEHHLPQISVNGSRTSRIANNLHITVPGFDNERLLIELEEQGIICAAGSACSAIDDTPSHVLGALGLSDADARSSLRFSLGRPTSKQDIDTAVEKLTQLIR